MTSKSSLEGSESSVEDVLASGTFYRKQFNCESKVIAWSHRSRFEQALRLIGSSSQRVLDYGCGDGTFLALASPKIASGWGADINPSAVEECQTRLASFSKLHFSTIAELSDPMHTAAYDVVTCMETLEHCTEPIVEVVLGDLSRLVAPGGRIIISVPIEIGPTFLLKTVIRKQAGWRGIGQYSSYETYSLRDAFHMLFAGRTPTVTRPDPTNSHYGFNWRALRERVREHLVVERTVFTPVGWLGGFVSSQAWLLCRPRLGALPG